MDELQLIFTSALDIFITAVIIYIVIRLLVKTEKMLFIINAIILFFVIYFISSLLNLNTVLFLLNSVTTWIVVIVFILFQKEIRDSLEKIGSISSLFTENTDESIDFINSLNDTVGELSKTKTGALITLERDVSLTEYIDKAVKLNSDFSKELIETIFNKNSILHDGAVIIRGSKIICASAYYPISLDLNLDKSFGTRHRAGVTISRESDSITIIVSEERGDVSIAYQGKIYQNISKEFFTEFIKEKYNEE